MPARPVAFLALGVVSALSAVYANRVLALAAGDPYSSAVLADSPAAYWRLDQVGTVPDLGGSSAGTTSGGVSLDAAGALASSTDPALSFDGVSGYVSLPASPVVEPTATLSVEAWIQATSLPNAASVIRLRCNTQDCGYALAVNGSAGGNSPFFYVVDSAGAFHVVTGPTSVVDGKWHHLVGTKDAIGLHLYVDGVSVGSLTYGGATYYGTVTGFSLARDGDDPNFYFHGSLDEVAVYGTALTPAQVAGHYTAANAPVPPPSTGSCPTPRSGAEDHNSSGTRKDLDRPTKPEVDMCDGRGEKKDKDPRHDHHARGDGTEGRDRD